MYGVIVMPHELQNVTIMGTCEFFVRNAAHCLVASFYATPTVSGQKIVFCFVGGKKQFGTHFTWEKIGNELFVDGLWCCIVIPLGF